MVVRSYFNFKKLGLNGGGGSDTLWGGAGNDAFVFDFDRGADRHGYPYPQQVDVIKDWNRGDRIQVEDGIFGDAVTAAQQGTSVKLVMREVWGDDPDPASVVIIEHARLADVIVTFI